MVDQILGALAEGRSLRSICRDEGMPNLSTVLRWVAEDDDFASKYARARDVQAEGYAGEIVEIADTDPDPARARNRISSRQWYASKLRSKVYGDRQQIEHSGAVGSDMTLEQWADARVAEGTAHPTLIPVIRAWAQGIIDRLPTLEE